jgi:thioredoxin 1
MGEFTKAATDSNFENDVLGSGQPVLVDFWAEWCGPCRAIAPTVDAVAEAVSGKATVYKMNVDDNPQIPNRYGIRGIPTLIVFKNGAEQERFVGGNISREKLIEMVTKYA